MFDVDQIREDFPILKRKINGQGLVYFDNAATSQKPQQVIEAISSYYSLHNANVHRGLHTLAEESTELFEKARSTIAEFINAKSPNEIVFVRNATEALNLIVWSYGKSTLTSYDEVLLTEMEHHSNIVPWQLLSKEIGFTIKYIPFDANGELSTRYLTDQISNRTKIVSLTHVSNSLGTINPIKEIAKIVHQYGAKIVVDAAQSVPHMNVDVQSLDADFLVFSGHKMLGPMGCGVLFARLGLLNDMPPFLSGGDMIKTVSITGSTWNDVPYKFEAGTPNVADAVGLASAVTYLEGIGMEAVRDHELKLTTYALKRMSEVKDLEIYGPKDSAKRGGVIAFNLKGIHAHDLASILDSSGIAVRSGHHCTMPVHTKLGIPASARISFYIYNKEGEIDKFIDALNKARNIFDPVSARRPEAG